MPLYDRSCNTCQMNFEIQCKIAEKDNSHLCPECGSTDGSWTIGAPVISVRPDRLMTAKKDGGFAEVLAKIKERNKRTEISKR